MNYYPTKKSLWVFLTIFIVHGSAVFGFNVDECVEQIFQKFDQEKTPKENFIFAFEHYDREYFLSPTKNESASGYFENLFDSVEQFVENNITPPIVFCEQYENEPDKKICKEALALLLSDEESNPNLELLRVMEIPKAELLQFIHLFQNLHIFLSDKEPELDLLGVLNLPEIKIIKHCYLTQTKLNLVMNKVFPYQYEVEANDKTPEFDRIYLVTRLERKARGETIKIAKIDIMQGYFALLLDEVKTIANMAVFKEPIAYCKSILGVEDDE